MREYFAAVFFCFFALIGIGGLFRAVTEGRDWEAFMFIIVIAFLTPILYSALVVVAMDVP